jgi:hypothetical protein
MWTQIVNMLIALWLIISVHVFGMNQTSADNNYIVGPLVISFSIISLWKINRNAIKINILPGAWLLVALFAIRYNNTIVFFSNGCCGVIIIIVSAIKTKMISSFGGGWRSLFQHDPLHLREAEKISAQRQ